MLERLEDLIDEGFSQVRHVAINAGRNAIAIFRAIGIKSFYWGFKIGSWITQIVLISTPFLIFLASILALVTYSYFTLIFAIFLFGVSAIATLMAIVDFQEGENVSIKRLTTSANSPSRHKEESIISKIIPRTLRNNSLSVNIALAIYIVTSYAVSGYNYLYPQEFSSIGFRALASFHGFFIENIVHLINLVWLALIGATGASFSLVWPEAYSSTLMAVGFGLMGLCVVVLLVAIYGRSIRNSQAVARLEQSRRMIASRPAPQIPDMRPVTPIQRDDILRSTIPFTITIDGTEAHVGYLELPKLWGQKLKEKLVGMSYGQLLHHLENSADYEVYRDERNHVWVQRKPKDISV